jgi:NAD(P)H-nitrite reductase large subunit
MTATTPDPRKEVICPCSGTTVAQIQRQLDKGVTDLEGISQATGALSGCGGCEWDIRDLLLALAEERAGPAP